MLTNSLWMVIRICFPDDAFILYKCMLSVTRVTLLQPSTEKFLVQIQVQNQFRHESHHRLQGRIFYFILFNKSYKFLF